MTHIVNTETGICPLGPDASTTCVIDSTDDTYTLTILSDGDIVCDPAWICIYEGTFDGTTFIGGNRGQLEGVADIEISMTITFSSENAGNGPSTVTNTFIDEFQCQWEADAYLTRGDVPAPPLPPPPGTVNNVAGDWRIIEQDISSNNPVDCPLEGASYTLTISQTATNLEFYIGSDYVRYGTIEGDSFNIYGSYPEDGGFTSSVITATVDSTCTNVSGSSIWYWSNSDSSCSGSASFSGTRMGGGSCN